MTPRSITNSLATLKNLSSVNRSKCKGNCCAFAFTVLPVLFTKFIRLDKCRLPSDGQSAADFKVAESHGRLVDTIFSIPPPAKPCKYFDWIPTGIDVPAGGRPMQIVFVNVPANNRYAFSIDNEHSELDQMSFARC